MRSIQAGYSVWIWIAFGLSHGGMLLYESSLASELLFGRQRDVSIPPSTLERTRPPSFRTLRSSFTRDSERLAVRTSRLPRFWSDHFQGHGTRKITCLSMSDARWSTQPYAMCAKSCYESKPRSGPTPPLRASVACSTPT